jgi:hypothetical protein
MAELAIKVEFVVAPEVFAGELCSFCDTKIFGDGFRLVLSVTQKMHPLPTFKETGVVSCSSCRQSFWLNGIRP